MNYSQVYGIVLENGPKCGYKFNVQHADGKKEVKRLFISTGENLCEFMRRSRRRGYIYTVPSTVVNIEPCSVSCKTPVEVLRHNCGRIITMLAKSGLWPDILDACQCIASLSDDEAQELIGLYRQSVNYTDYTTEEREEYRKAYENIFTSLGYPIYNFYEFSNLLEKKAIVSIPYGKYGRERDRLNVSKAIKEAVYCTSKERVKTAGMWWRGSYDYSIEVSHCEDGMARGWFSAEYKDCGNGHYYLMLDESHALFCEND